MRFLCFVFRCMDAKILWYAYRGTEEWNLCYILPEAGKK